MEKDLRTDTLPGTRYKIFQDKDFFCYGIDAVLLADFTAKNGGDFTNAVDLCSGNGAVALMLGWKKKSASITGIEIQSEMAELAQKSVGLNQIKNVKILKGDVKKISETAEKSSCEVVAVNPPYMKRGSGRRSKNERKAIAREEILCTLADVISAADFLLKNSGKLFMIHRPERLSEIQKTLSEHGFVTGRIRFVIPKKGEKATMVLIQAEKTGSQTQFGQKQKPEEDELIVYGADGTYTDEVKRIYESEK